MRFSETFHLTPYPPPFISSTLPFEKLLHPLAVMYTCMYLLPPILGYHGIKLFNSKLLVCFAF